MKSERKAIFDVRRRPTSSCTREAMTRLLNEATYEIEMFVLRMLHWIGPRLQNRRRGYQPCSGGSQSSQGTGLLDEQDAARSVPDAWRANDGLTNLEFLNDANQPIRTP